MAGIFLCNNYEIDPLACEEILFKVSFLFSALAAILVIGVEPFSNFGIGP